VRGIVAGLRASEHFDLVHEIALRLPLAVICHAIGIPEDDVAQFHEWATDVGQFAGQVDPAWGPQVQTALERSNESWLELESMFRRLIEARRRSPVDDLLSELVRSSDSGQISDEELIGLAVFFLAAGHTTTRDLLANGLYLLLAHPRERLKLNEEPTLIGPAIEEVLRFESPIPMASRLVGEDVELGGMSLPKGDSVILHLGAANRDPTRFERASRFEVTRKSNRHLAFGWGAHFCLGAPLAREQATVVLEELLPVLGQMVMDAPEPAWWMGDMSVRTLSELCASWVGI
jgi:cytochrome P450